MLRHRGDRDGPACWSKLLVQRGELRLQGLDTGPGVGGGVGGRRSRGCLPVPTAIVLRCRLCGYRCWRGCCGWGGWRGCWLFRPPSGRLSSALLVVGQCHSLAVEAISLLLRSAPPPLPETLVGHSFCFRPLRPIAVVQGQAELTSHLRVQFVLARFPMPRSLSLRRTAADSHLASSWRQPRPFVTSAPRSAASVAFSAHRLSQVPRCPGSSRRFGGLQS